MLIDNQHKAMTKLVTFGDSWVVGTELESHEKNFSTILADMLNLKHENHGISGASNDETFLQLKNYCASKKPGEEVIAVILITSPIRSLYIDHDNNRRQILPKAKLEDKDRDYYFFKYFHSPAQEALRLELCLNALQNLCREYNIKDYYISGWADIDLDSAGINKKRFFPKTCAELFDAPTEHEFSFAGSNKYIYPNNCHPNQLGHQLIAKELYNWIKHAKD